MDLRCFASLLLVVEVSSSFNLTILHTNDVHGRFRQSNVYGGVCSTADAENNRCYGGFPRLVSKVKELRADKPDNTLVLDAGGQFHGSLWFNFFTWNITAHFVNLLRYDVMTLGNHEFDLGADVLNTYMENVNSKFVSTNMDISDEPALSGLFEKSVTLTVGGEKVGIVGYVTPETTNLSFPGKVKFQPIIPTVRAEVEKLKQEGVNKVIALGHAGYEFDLQVAKEVEGIDIIVGGFSNTFLFSGENRPSIERPEGPYPTVVEQESGAKVLIVQAFWQSKYLGHLDIEFDADGVVTSWQGGPILLNNYTTEDPETIKGSEFWVNAFNVSSHEVIGSTNVDLEAARPICRKMECNLGNAVADGMIYKCMSMPRGVNQWTSVPIALVNSGALRAPIARGEIKAADVMAVIIYRNVLVRGQMKGVHLLQALEHGVSRYPFKEDDYLHGSFLQFSGLIVSYDLDQKNGSRVVDVQARCADCLVPKFEPLDKDKMYTIALSSFIANGGDGFSVIPDNLVREPYAPVDALDSQVLMDYVKENSPLWHGREGRIRFVKTKTEKPCPSTATHITTSTVYTLTLLAVLFLFF